MPNFEYTWTDEQILEVNGRAVGLFLQLNEDNEIPPTIHAAVYQGVLNQCGQVEVTQVQKGTVLPRMDVPRQR